MTWKLIFPRAIFPYALILATCMGLFAWLTPLPSPAVVSGKVQVEEKRGAHTYRGVLLSKRGLPCLIHSNLELPLQTVRFHGGKLMYTHRHMATLTLESFYVEKEGWLHQLRSFARGALKNRLSYCQLPKKASSLATTLLLAEKPRGELSYLFRTVGMSHFLVVSGFHFMLVAGLLGFFLKRHHLWIFCGITLYFLFLGTSPSITRAFLAISFFLLTQWLDLPFAPLDVWGLSFIFSLISQPHLITNLGFQLSYGATIGILLYTRPALHLLERFSPKRTLEEYRALPRFHRFLYHLLFLAKPPLALSIAVNLIVLPILALHFSEIPLIGIAYNLYATPCFILLFFFLLAALPFPFFLPLWGKATSAFLAFLSTYPRLLAQPLSLTPLGQWVLLVYCMGLAHYLRIKYKPALHGTDSFPNYSGNPQAFPSSRVR